MGKFVSLHLKLAAKHQLYLNGKSSTPRWQELLLPPRLLTGKPPATRSRISMTEKIHRFETIKVYIKRFHRRRALQTYLGRLLNERVTGVAGSPAWRTSSSSCNPRVLFHFSVHFSPLQAMHKHINTQNSSVHGDSGGEIRPPLHHKV